MPDEPRHGDASRHATPSPDGYERSGGRRRRSMEESGGLSVSDLVARHGASNPNLTPVAPPPNVPAPPAPPAERFRTPEPGAQPTGRRARRLAEEQRRASRSQAIPRGGVSRNNLPPAEPPTEQDGGLKRPSRPAQPPRALPPQYRTRPQDTGRTRERNDIAAPRNPEPPVADAPQPPAPQPPAAQPPAPVAPPPVPAGQPTGRRARRLAEEQRLASRSQAIPRNGRMPATPPAPADPPADPPAGPPAGPQSAAPGPAGPSGPPNPGPGNPPLTPPRSTAATGAWDRAELSENRLPTRTPAPGRPRRPRASQPQPGTGRLPMPPGPPTRNGMAPPPREQRPAGPPPMGDSGPIGNSGPIAPGPIGNSGPLGDSGPIGNSGPIAPGPIKGPGPAGRPGMGPNGPGNTGAPPNGNNGIGNRLSPDADAPADAAPIAPLPKPPSKPRMKPAGGPGPERREEMDPICLTSEMEPISEEVQKKRKVDATLVRFSAVHDEMMREERERRTKRAKLIPWMKKDNEVDEVLSEMAQAGPRPAAPQETGEYRPVFDDDDEDDLETSSPQDRPAVEKGGPPRKPPAGKGKAGGGGGSRPPRKRNRKAVLAAKLGATATAVLILVITFMGWRARAQVENTPIAQVAALDENSTAIQDAQRQMGDENFLIVGTSTDNGVATPALSTVMVAHVPADRSRAVVVSFPIDLSVNRPACTKWNNAGSANTGDSVPAASGVALGAVYQAGGPKCLTETVQQLSGLRINHFVGIDAAGFASLISDVSGIPLCVKAPIADSQLGTVVGQTGNVTLTGQQALNFVLANHVNGDSVAAHNQIHRQQVFLAAALRQAVGTQGLLLSTTKLNDFLSVFTKAAFGQNMAVDDLFTLAQSLQGTDLSKVTFVTLPTTGTLDATGDETLVTSEATQLFTQLINNSPLTTGAAAGGTANGSNAPVDPKTVRIQVNNAGADTAASTANKLTNVGFQVVSKGTDPNVPATVIRYSADEQAAARTLNSAVPAATLQVDPTLNGAIILDIGPGFDGKVQTPTTLAPNPAGTTTGTATSLSTMNASDTGCA